ncbi:ABC transporter substrate-binding protein [Nesterenkonia sandarakina]|uniref:NitT/TauT family transport system substrate-binding protein n=1 Tax=Nesterenkonia sandarakina TaxID=272918 RepID=A0A2T0YR98_9MICC|nr:ABC transporter substrate-binding protein [Nesterenkonia sandarakina]PRZ18090.1 NitT/TauT family transport system substrate-binding protein [Nesterenkonia sandarakina]
MKHLSRGAFALCAVLALSACGSGSPSGDADGEPADDAEAGSGELTEVELGLIPIVDVAPIYLGQQEGIFEEHGIELTLTLAQGGAAIIPAVSSGDMDFGFSNVTSLLIAADNGLPLQTVAAGPQTTGDSENDFGAVLVKPDSGIESAQDLEGQRVAVNTLNNISDSMISEGVLEAGGEPSNVDFVEVAFPDMLAQLEADNVDAIFAVDPFASMADNEGYDRIFAPYADVVEELGVGTYFASQQLVDEDPELVESFHTAVRESQAYAAENPEAVRQVLLEYTSIDESMLEELAIPAFPEDVNLDSLEEVAEISERHGLIGEVPNIDDLVWEGAR